MYVLGCNGINASPNKMELLIVTKAQKTSNIDKLIVSKCVFRKILDLRLSRAEFSRAC